jgi:hypothetical protein
MKKEKALKIPYLHLFNNQNDFFLEQIGKKINLIVSYALFFINLQFFKEIFISCFKVKILKNYMQSREQKKNYCLDLGFLDFFFHF